MTSAATTGAAPVPFTVEDYTHRMSRVVDEVLEVGLDGVVVSPGPDLKWLTGYQPTAITERLTMLVLAPGVRPTLLVPLLERPDAEAAAGAAGGALVTGGAEAADGAGAAYEPAAVGTPPTSRRRSSRSSRAAYPASPAAPGSRMRAAISSS